MEREHTLQLSLPLRRVTIFLSYFNGVLIRTQSEAYASAIDYLRPGGTLMVVGLPGHAKLEASIFFTVLKGISILGSYVGYVFVRRVHRSHYLMNL